MYDLFFLSHGELLAERHWQLLIAAQPHARRVDGVDGILAAHRHCATISRTSNFFVVDADSEILGIDFGLKLSEYDKKYVHIWRALNPVNGLVYGWGGIKLFPKKVLLQCGQMPLDMTMSFDIKIMWDVASITHFNTSPFDTWRSAFRECVKLSQNDDPESRERLVGWCTIAEGAFAEWCLRGASEGREYGVAHKGTPEILKINDWMWLKAMFEESNEKENTRQRTCHLEVHHA